MTRWEGRSYRAFSTMCPLQFSFVAMWPSISLCRWPQDRKYRLPPAVEMERSKMLVSDRPMGGGFLIRFG
jgi:hypothetical protein